MYEKASTQVLFSVIVVTMLIVACLPGIDAVNGNQPPIADFWVEETDIKTNDTVHFHDNSSDDDGFIIAWQWDFDDGSSSIKQNPSHRYEESGTYQVNLTVIDNNGTKGWVVKPVTVQNRPPTADAGPDQTVNTSQVSFDGTGSQDPDGFIDTYKWTFDDGTSPGHGALTDHTYAEDGNYTVTLNVTDNNGDYDTDICNVTVDTTPPTTNISLSGTTGEHEWYISNVSMVLNATDEVTGVGAVYYRVDNGNWTSYTTAVTLSEEGTHLVEYYAVDAAGNTEPVKNVTIKIDTTAPAVTITTPEEGYLYLFNRRIIPTLLGNTYAFGRITIEATVNASPASVDKVRFLVDAAVEYTDSEEPYAWRWGRAFGRHTIGVRAIDLAGHNVTEERQVTIFSLLSGQSIAEGDSHSPSAPSTPPSNQETM